MDVDAVKALGLDNDKRLDAIRARGVNVSPEVLLGLQIQALVHTLWPEGWHGTEYVAFEAQVQARLSAWLDSAEKEVEQQFAAMAAEQRKQQLLQGVRVDGGNNGATGQNRV
jgi:hypothetical protein